MPDVELRFLTAQTKADTDQAGLVMELNGTVWLVDADGNRTQLPGGGGACDALYCDDDEASLTANTVAAIGQAPDPPVATSQAIACVIDTEGTTRAAFDATLDVSQAFADAAVRVRDSEDTVVSSLVLNAQDGTGFAEAVLTADRVHFDGGTAIVRPTFDLSSGTVADLAQMLADLGLITVVP